MKDNQTTALSLLASLREELSNASGMIDERDFIYLSQSFDRLFMGYQNGTYDSSAVEEGVNEIRASISSSQSSSQALLPLDHISHRDSVLARNYEALAERLLGQERGSWDSRHVEVVQGAIVQLSSFNSPSYNAIAHQLQQRMSESVWVGNLELAETVSQFEQESRNLQASLLEVLQNKQEKLEPETRDVDTSDMTLAHEDESAVKTVIQTAGVHAMQSQSSSSSQNMPLPRFMPQTDNGQNAEVLERVIDGIRHASGKVIEAEYKKLTSIYKSALAQVSKELSPDRLASATAQLDSLFGTHAVTSENLREKSAQLRNYLKDLGMDNSFIKQAIRETESIHVRANILSEIETSNNEVSSKQAADNVKQQLDARLLFEQKRMQFEQTSSQTNDADMLKALDYEIPTPVFQVSQPKLEDNIKRLQQVAQSAASGDAGLYAPRAGAEYVPNTSVAIRTAEKSAPMSTLIPAIHSSTAARANRLMKDMHQVSYHPSVRADMGFASAPRFQIDSSSAQPLFKRVRFNRNDPESQRFLPALYKVAGIQVKPKKTDAPLRKSFANLNLQNANAKIVDIIESYFGDSGEVGGRLTDKVTGMAFDAAQTMVKGNTRSREVGGVISDWIDSRRDTRREYTNDADLIKTGQMATSNIEATIRSEAMSIPTSVKEKLSPFLGFDMSKVKVYSGPVAAMAAEAMGAHAFTLGQNIFLGENKLDFNSAEGLGLLAHEILHTSHFSSGQSVDAKEQAAEALETKVKTALGNSDKPAFAKEGDGGKRKSALNLKTNGTMLPVDSKSIGSKFTYDPDELFEIVSERVTEMILESMKLHAESKGGDDEASGFDKSPCI